MKETVRRLTETQYTLNQPIEELEGVEPLCDGILHVLPLYLGPAAENHAKWMDVKG